ncbi:MAG: DUF6444 domain-containing protein [Treponema sp.]|nr:DUF6444 domain-containing protein [Treponema sp.]
MISEQAETIKNLEALVRELRETIARLQKDSRNSSKPPSYHLRYTKDIDNGLPQKVFVRVLWLGYIS